MTHYLPKRYARSLLRLLPAAEVDEFLLSKGWNSEQLAGQGQLPVEDYGRLFMGIIHHIQPLLHGEQASRFSQISNYGLIYRAMVQTKTLREAIGICDAFMARLLPESNGCPLTCEEDVAHWHFDMSIDVNDDDWSVDTFSTKQFHWGPSLMGRAVFMWVWHRFACWLVGSYIELDRVELIDKAPAKPEHYTQLFDCAVHYNQSSCSLYFPERYLDYPIVQSVERVDNMQATFPAELFNVDQRSLSDTARIRTMIGSDFSRPMPSAEEIAERMHISIATLHRHLQREKTSVQRIKSEARHQAALDYLSRVELSIGEITDLLGYSDISAFCRAFKKWTGKTPADFRASDQ